MSDEQDKLKLSLGPPKLFGRKKKGTEPAGASAPTATEGPAPKKAPKKAVKKAAREAAESTTARSTASAAVPADDAPAAALAPDTTTADRDTVTEPAPEPVPDPAPDPQPVLEPASAPEPPQAEVEPEPVDGAALEDAEIVALPDRGPLLTAYRAAALTGLVVGAAMVGLTWLALRGCEAVRGTSSCGGGPGFLLLVATFAVCVLLGSQLLKTFLIPDPGSSSFLAVGLVAVVALLFLIDFLDSWSMLVVVPVLSIGGYLASVWVTRTFVEPVDT